MVDLATVIGVLGVATTVAIFGGIYWDATRVDVSRPMLWAAVAAGAFGVGIGLYLFAEVPTTGVIMTANTGLVLYGFEREIAREDDEDAEPGTLPHRE
ncbi:hypothetical protein D8Y22_08150 [Salinadaptatus halalkaliphilus]|uniref:Uncharacterized protein n=1 Tax=Salinadaptatus halalkaliphilus TaxID=2419781 RepID=A0A4S3TNG5_9EURY|nr:hypothetical protein [Salinadaptatus halalkaliphilus]THE65180.1 hypothetical protein D8Y22_08150 [Salinadaptatus halalkaliphilus]